MKIVLSEALVNVTVNDCSVTEFTKPEEKPKSVMTERLNQNKAYLLYICCGTGYSTRASRRRIRW
jgi:hypothetical protein